MKRILLIVSVAAAMLCPSHAQEIQMVKDGNSYTVPCLLNGMKTRMTYSENDAISISETVANLMYDNGYFSDADVAGALQNGKLKAGSSVVLRDVEIGGKHIQNVRAIIKEQNASIVLGKAAIVQDGMIVSGSSLITDLSTIKNVNATVENGIDKLIADKQYDQVIRELNKKKSSEGGLSSYYLMQLANGYYQTEQWDECIRICEEWKKNFSTSQDATERRGMEDIYNWAAQSYMNKARNSDDTKNYQKALEWLNSDASSMISSRYGDMTEAYQAMGDMVNAKKSIRKAISSRIREVGANYVAAQAGQVKDSTLAKYYEMYAKLPNISSKKASKLLQWAEGCR